jgi:hypothetical protein
MAGGSGAGYVVGHYRTTRFSVLQPLHQIPEAKEKTKVVQHNLPVVDLGELLLHSERNTTSNIQRRLRQALDERGFCLLTCPKDSKPGRVIQNLQQSVKTNLFPSDGSAQKNAGRLPTSDSIYVSEKGVPMYKLGYELSEDKVREFYRINGGDEGDCGLSESYRAVWRQGMGLCRHVTDTALDLLTKPLADCPGRRNRPHSGPASWAKEPAAALRERAGDYSVLYAMHYFNNEKDPDTKLPADGVALAAHVDPSLLVMEPFLCPHSRGLQVWDRINNCWMDCDGPDSPLRLVLDEQQQQTHTISLIFGGKALAAQTGIEATLHRVVTGSRNRRIVIYEQKYEEYYPPPSMD